MTTLLELSGALGITSVLGIAAITSMSAAPGRADDVRARSSIHTAVITALSVEADRLLTLEHPADTMSAAEPGLDWTGQGSDDANVISVAVAAGTLGLAARSVSGSCFVARVSNDGDVALEEIAASASCSGQMALTS